MMTQLSIKKRQEGDIIPNGISVTRTATRKLYIRYQNKKDKNKRLVIVVGEDIAGLPEVHSAYIEER